MDLESSAPTAAAVPGATERAERYLAALLAEKEARISSLEAQLAAAQRNNASLQEVLAQSLKIVASSLPDTPQGAPAAPLVAGLSPSKMLSASREPSWSQPRLWETERRDPRPAQGLGIGIITYNRRQTLIECVAAVERHTTVPFHLVIADDGSQDGSAAWARACGIPVVTGRQQGVAWNKNRALAYLRYQTRCDPILLLEDDCWPEADGWEQPWLEGVPHWGFLSYAHPTWEGESWLGGSGTAVDPYLAARVAAQCVAVLRQHLEAVGYLDTRLAGWGYDHLEWVWRLGRALGYTSDELPALNWGLRLLEAGTFQDPLAQERSRRVFESLGAEPLQRPAVRGQVEQERQYREQQRTLWPRRAEAGASGLISVICPTRTPERARQMLASLGQGAAQGAYEVVWVWSGSGSCPLPGLVADYREVPFAYGEAINRGVLASNGAILLCVADDVVFTASDPLAPLRQAAQQYRDLGLVGGHWQGARDLAAYAANHNGANGSQALPGVGPQPFLLPQQAAPQGRRDGRDGAALPPLAATQEGLLPPALEAAAYDAQCWAVSRQAFLAMGGLEEGLLPPGDLTWIARHRLHELGFTHVRLQDWRYQTLLPPASSAAQVAHQLRQTAAAAGWRELPGNAMPLEATAPPSARPAQSRPEDHVANH